MECLKKRFTDRGAAEARLAEIRAGDPNTPLCRAYYCSKCQSFHLTSKRGFKSFYDATRQRRIERAAEYFIGKNGWAE